jgi:hypothetical protein
MAYIGTEPTIGNFQVCDAISVVNGQAAYTMQVGGVNVVPETANHMLVSLNGILQAPGSSYTVSGSTITFASNLVTGDVINFIHILGSVLDLGVPSDNTVSLAKLTATGTKDATTFLRGDNTFAAAGGGITEADMFRLTASQSGGTNADITTNLERVDDATFSKIGTGMSLSSGIYTFPSTGLYEVTCSAMILSSSDSNSYVIAKVSSDSGSSYDDIFQLNNGDTAGTSSTNAMNGSLVNVTNASTFRIKFTTSSMGGSSYVMGETASNYTMFKFIRLGDSQ